MNSEDYRSIFPSHWQYREIADVGAVYGWDYEIFRSVVTNNEYQIDNPVKPGTIVDIGAHIGSFCWAAHLCGANDFIAVEMMTENYRLLCENLDPLRHNGRLQLHHAACWASDGSVVCEPMSLGKNTGGTAVQYSGMVAEMVTLKSLLREVDVCSVLKIDAEGSEYPILIDSDLSKVDMLVCEVHDGFVWRNKVWTAHDLVPFLATQFPNVRVFPTAPGFWRLRCHK